MLCNEGYMNNPFDTNCILISNTNIRDWFRSHNAMVIVVFGFEGNVVKSRSKICEQTISTLKWRMNIK